jgi:hypothetical protein
MFISEIRHPMHAEMHLGRDMHEVPLPVFDYWLVSDPEGVERSVLRNSPTQSRETTALSPYADVLKPDTEREIRGALLTRPWDNITILNAELHKISMEKFPISVR